MNHENMWRDIQGEVAANRKAAMYEQFHKETSVVQGFVGYDKDIRFYST